MEINRDKINFLRRKKEIMEKIIIKDGRPFMVYEDIIMHI